MSATGTAQSQNTPPQKWQKGGPSPNPGGMPKGLRGLQGLVLLAHGPKVLTALQKLFEIGMDDRVYTIIDQHGEPVTLAMVEAKTRVAALQAFTGQVANMTGLASLGKAAGAGDDEPADEGELVDRVIDGVLSKPEHRERVQAKLVALEGGKR